MVEESAIPQDVIEALAAVRETGKTNMFDYQAVIHIVDDLGYIEAVAWLWDNHNRYVDALNAMGKAINPNY